MMGDKICPECGNHYCDEQISQLQTQLSQCKRERDRYREALKFYADEENYHTGDSDGTWIDNDEGFTAQTALEDNHDS